MNLLFIGGDMRYIKMIKDLKNKNNIKTIGYDNQIFEDIKKFDIKGDNIKNIDIIILPITGIKQNYEVDSCFTNKNIILPKNFFKNCKKNTYIFTGKINDILLSMINENTIINNLLDDYEIKKGNSLITVEGILDDLIKKRAGKTITLSNILVLGYGNIGKPLVNILNILGSNVCVGIKDKKDYVELKNKGIDVFYTDDHDKLKKHLSNLNTIINTVPSNIITSDMINCINKDCYILDISSYPYGFNNDDIKNNNYNIYSKIPSKYSPVVSGSLLEKKLNSIIGGKK